jgi:hypothetical protein
VIGLGGKIGAGKDAVAARLVERWGYRIVRFSDALKEEVLERLPGTLAALHEFSGHAHELSACSFAARAECIRDMVYNRKPAGVRELLQEYGTQVRRRDSVTYWTDQWAKRAVLGGAIVAPDVRFEGEANAILASGGLLWRVERPGTAIGTHESETVMDSFTGWSAIIHNDGTLDGLHAQVDVLMAERMAGVA